MAINTRQGSATITMGVDGADASRRDIESVADALRRMNAASLDRISDQVSGMEGRFSSLQSTIGNVVGFSIAGVSIGALVSKVNDAIGVMGDLDDMAQKTGSSVESLSRLQKVANAFGVDMGTIDSALTKLAKGMAGTDEKGTKTGKALAALGVSSREADGKIRSSADVMVDIAHKLQDYEDGAAKAALMNDLLGRSGADLLPYMNDLSENVDKFTGVSTESAKRAAALQDQFGFLRVRTDELYTSVAEATLPALTDLAGALTDVANEQEGMAAGKGIEWADDIAVGLARVVDVAILLPRLFKAIAGSFQVVGADLSVLWDAAPVNMAYKLTQGRDPIAEFKKTLAERNATLAEANNAWDIAWNKPANDVEQAVLKRIAGRNMSTLAAAAGINDISTKDAAKKTLKYGGSDDENKAAADAKRKDAALLAELSGVTADYMAKLEQLQRLRVSSNMSEERYVELVTELISKQPGAKAWMDDQAKAAEEARKYADETILDWEEIRKAHGAMTARTLEDATNEALKNEELARTFNLTKVEIEKLAVARLEDQLAQAAGKESVAGEIADLEKLIATKKRNIAALTTISTGDSAKKAAEDLNNFLDPSRAQSFGEALRESFGSAGTAISKLTGNLDGFARRQAEFDKRREQASEVYRSGLHSEQTYLQNVSRLNEMETKSRLSGYGDMASAAAGFFGEQSKGYQALMTVSKVFHAAELAMTLAELVPKGISAVLSQGSGDPYTAFGRMAAMAAIVAGLGVAIGSVSGGGIPVSQQRQETQGTGSVLGDPTAKSESISRSLGMIEDASFQGLSISTDMLSALRNIESNIGNFTALLVRDTGVSGDFGSEYATRGSADEFGRSNLGLSLAIMPVLGPLMDKLTGGLLGKITGSMLGKMFGGKTTVEDTGFGMSKADFAAIRAGEFSAVQYADIKKDGGWFRSDKTSTQSAPLAADGNRQIQQVLTSLYTTVHEAGQMLGLRGDEFAGKLDGFVVDIGKISLKGLKDDEIQKELEAVFSKVGDDLARFGAAGLEQFQQIGEGYLETLTRVATGYQTVAVVTESLGMTFSTLGFESVEARERLLSLSGGVEAFASSAEKFLSDFYSDEEQANALRARLTPTLDQYGIATGAEDSLKQFRNVVTGLNLTTAAGAQAYATLMQIAPAFKQIADVDAAVFAERADLQNQLDELTLTSTRLLAKQRDAVKESNRTLFDQLQLAERAAEVASERAGLQDQIDQLTMSPSDYAKGKLDVSNRSVYDQLQQTQVQKAASEALEAANKSLLDQIHEIERASMTQQQLRDDDIKGMHSSTVALHDLLQAKKKELEAIKANHEATEKAAEAIKAAQEAAAATIRSFGDSIMSAMQRAQDAAKAIRDFSSSLYTGSLSALDADARYREAKKQFEAADASDTQAAQAFLQASKDRGADELYYRLDFAAVQAKLAKGAADLDAYAARLPDFYRGVAQMMSSPTFTSVVAPSSPQESQGSMSKSSSQVDNSRVVKVLEEVSSKLDNLGAIANNTGQFADQFDRVTEGGSAMVNA